MNKNLRNEFFLAITNYFSIIGACLDSEDSWLIWKIEFFNFWTPNRSFQRKIRTKKGPENWKETKYTYKWLKSRSVVEHDFRLSRCRCKSGSTFDHKWFKRLLSETLPTALTRHWNLFGTVNVSKCSSSSRKSWCFQHGDDAIWFDRSNFDS